MDTNTKHFTPEALQNLIAAEGKVVTGIVCYFWVNHMNANDPVELIDNVELRFSDNTHIIIAGNEEGEGLEVLTDFDYMAEQAHLEKEFNGKIRVIPVDAAKTKMWSEIPGKILDSVGLTKDGDQYLSDSILLNFGEEKRIITLGPLDGLIIDYYED